MKREYVRPTAVAELFVTNEFCANPACGMKNGKYIFTCDAPEGTVYYYKNDTATKLGGYHPCSKKHETEGTGNYYDGFVDYNGNKTEDVGEGALIWIEWNKYPYPNYHASASLSREQINVERS